MPRLTAGAARLAPLSTPSFSRTLATATLLLGVLAPAASAQFSAQLPRNRTRARRDNSRIHRETSANRRARIEREIAQTYAHKYEYSGGGGYLRFRSGQYLQKNSEVTFYSSLNYFLNPKLSVLGDVHGAYGTAKIGNTIYNIPNPKISQYTFSAGPSYRFYAQRRTAATVFATGGVALGNFAGGTKGFFPDRLGLWSTTLRPVVTAGVNLDVNLYQNFAIRVTPTYIGTLFDGAAPAGGTQTVHGTIQNNVGVNVGIVYRFGQR